MRLASLLVEDIGRDVVERNGGKVVLAELVPGKSTTNIIEKIRKTIEADGRTP